ncbi:MAG: pyrimidine-nucleoside phosphorylase [Syntrophomonas sp.]|nr:pyrimidine-nucleoside phosphorylase [Syntrophomonas sp.]
MRMVDIIQKKKDGGRLTREEIDYFVNGYTRGEIPDYQMSALLMAICFRGMTQGETSELTMAYVNSGEILDLSRIEGIKVDKHSTGGVGDKVSIIVIPLVASVGVPVAKMSGRGLGHTGGTIDKLESIRGFNTALSQEQFVANVNRFKMAIAGQSADLTPADKKIYALRDVTATIDSIPLIASSVMSKKIASGADAIVLDVKVGSGAFMKTIAEARELSAAMVEIGRSLDREIVAVISDMSQPLGHQVGNALEIKEVIEVLKGGGAEDLTLVSLTIASHMAVLGGAFKDFDSAYQTLAEIISSGQALAKLRQLVEIQGGEVDLIDHPDHLPSARHQIEIKSPRNGFVHGIEADGIGTAAMLLGAGRRTKEDSVDYAAGITLIKKVGDKVRMGQTLCILHTNLEEWQEAESIAGQSYKINALAPGEPIYIYEVLK